MDQRTCVLPDCGKPPRNRTAELCGMHYHRMYRHGSFDKVATDTDVTASHGRRYRSIYVPGHPLASKHGKVYEHRFVLYGEIGEGPHACHWCSAPLEWVAKGEPNCLHVDHLNSIGDDNSPENLVPSCQACNTARAQERRSIALRDAGWWSENDTIARLRSGGRKCGQTRRSAA